MKLVVEDVETIEEDENGEINIDGEGIYHFEFSKLIEYVIMDAEEFIERAEEESNSFIWKDR